MKIKSFFPYIAISLIALVTRLPLIEVFQSHWDGADYSIAIIRYSLAENTPTPPGYPLYLAIGKFFNLFIEDPHKSIVLVSVLASIIGAIAFYAYGRKIYNKYVGIAATAIFLTGSTFYYFSLTPYGYELITAFIVILALVIYQTYILKKQNGILFGLVLGICFGIRPQEMLLIGPLALLGFIFLSKKNKIYTILTFLIITFLWLLPMIRDTGGVQNYIALNLNAASADGFTHSFMYNLPLAIKGLLLTCGISAIFLAYYPYKLLFKKIKINKKVSIFYLVWILPGIFYNLFVRGEHAGYQVSYLTAIIILISYAMWKVNEKRIFLFYFFVFIVAIFNLYWFFYDRDPNYSKPFRPTSFHYSDIRKNDLIIGNKVNYVKNNFNSNNTLLISTEAAWRQYSYYLKDYRIVALNALNNTEKPYIYNKFEGQNWNQKRSLSKNFSLNIPDKISQIILMDTQMNDWLIGINHQVINLPGNSRITIIPIKKNPTMLYDYHFIKFSN